MITKISGEQPFQVLCTSFSISPSESGYNLEISADGVNYSPLFTVGAGVTRLVTGVAANSYYRLAGNTSDVVVNWQKSCGGDGHDGGGGGTGATITVDSALSSSSTNPVENRVITNALAEIEGGTVDSALTSGSTNAVESRAIWDAINGVTSTTQMEISDVQSGHYAVFSNGVPNTYFYETNIPGYYAIFLGDLQVGRDDLYINRIHKNGASIFYPTQTEYLEESYLGRKFSLLTSGIGLFIFDNHNFDGTFDYYLIYNAEEDFVMFVKLLPVITEVTEHKANISDVPTAQDGSDFKKFVYFGADEKRVLTNFYGGGNQTFGDTQGDSHPTLNVVMEFWNGLERTYGVHMNLPYGNEIIGGAKTARDSKIIDQTENIINGFTEQITLTVTGNSIDTAKVNWNNVTLSATDDPRYVVYALPQNNFVYFNEVTLGGTKYYISNRNYGTSNSFTNNGVYQLIQKQYGEEFIINTTVAGSNYIIFDKELLTLEIADSLTITRGKNLADAFDNIPQPDMSDYWTTAQTQNAIEEALYGAVITGATMPVDSQLSTASTNPVENRVITNKFADYYTKQEADALIADMATETYVDNAIANIPAPDLSGYATTGDVQNAVSGLASTTYVDTAINNLDLTDVVRSTSISTIVRCTQAQYDAIAIKDEGTLYIITGVNP